MEKLSKVNMTDYTGFIGEAITEGKGTGGEKAGKIAAAGYTVLICAAFLLNLLVVFSLVGLFVLAALNII